MRSEPHTDLFMFPRGHLIEICSSAIFAKAGVSGGGIYHDGKKGRGERDLWPCQYRGLFTGGVCKERGEGKRSSEGDKGTRRKRPEALLSEKTYTVPCLAGGVAYQPGNAVSKKFCVQHFLGGGFAGVLPGGLRHAFGWSVGVSGPSRV